MVRSPPLALALFHELDTRVLESLRSFGGHVVSPAFLGLLQSNLMGNRRPRETMRTRAIFVGNFGYSGWRHHPIKLKNISTATQARGRLMDMNFNPLPEPIIRRWFDLHYSHQTVILRRAWRRVTNCIDRDQRVTAESNRYQLY